MIKTKFKQRYSSASIKNIDPHIAEIMEKSIKERKGHGMYICGDTGLGKTYIAYAIYNRVIESGLPCVVVKTLDIIDAIKMTFMGIPSPDSDQYDTVFEMYNFLKDLSSYKGLLIIDDMGAEKGSEAVVVKLFQIIDNRYENMYHTIYTSNLDLNELAEKVGERIVSRIAEDCEIIKLTGDDKRV